MECWELPGPFGDPGLMKNHHLGLMYGNINPAVTGIIVALMNEAIRGNYFTCYALEESEDILISILYYSKLE